MVIGIKFASLPLGPEVAILHTLATISEPGSIIDLPYVWEP